MYDYLTLSIDLPEPLPQSEAALLNSPAFAEWDGVVDKHGRIRVEYRGLRIDYRHGQYKGRVRGSLHTFAQGSNVSVFAAAEVADACVALAAALHLPPEVFVVRKLEAGVNLSVPDSPKGFLGKLIHHKNKPFWALKPPRGVTRPLEFVSLHSAYHLKYYDKGTYAFHQGVPLPEGCRHLLRFEVVFSRARNLRQLTGREQVTLADLSAPEVMVAVAGHLLAQWALTKRRIPLDYSGLSLAQMALLKSGSKPEWWEDVRPYVPKSTFLRNRRVFSRLHRQAVARVKPHPYDLLFPEQLKALLPVAHQPDESAKSGTVCHPCNQVEVATRGGGVLEGVLLRANSTRMAALAA